MSVHGECTSLPQEYTITILLMHVHYTSKLNMASQNYAKQTAQSH